jgi:hypothetical protein
MVRIRVVAVYPGSFLCPGSISQSTYMRRGPAVQDEGEGEEAVELKIQRVIVLSPFVTTTTISPTGPSGTYSGSPKFGGPIWFSKPMVLPTTSPQCRAIVSCADDMPPNHMIVVHAAHGEGNSPVMDDGLVAGDPPEGYGSAWRKSAPHVHHKMQGSPLGAERGHSDQALLAIAVNDRALRIPSCRTASHVRSRPLYRVKRSILPFVALSFWCSMSVMGQNDIGLNPPSKRWSVIKAPTGPIIYPDGCDSLAFRVADIMRYEQEADHSLLGENVTRRVPLVIQNGSTLPAGFSTPAPWRNELYITPPYNMFLGPTDWLSGLTAHEYRHTQQFHAARSGWGKLYLGLMGQTGWLFNSLLTQPLWFREGDAVLMETLLSNAGRGRLPAFHMEYRALRLSGMHFNYEKAHFGSFRDQVPNAYKLGYYMVTKARREHGDDVWTNAIRGTYRKGFIWPLSRGLQEVIGVGTRGLYQRTVAELDSVWLPLDKGRGTLGARSLEATAPRMFTSYRYPHYDPQGRVIALCSGFDRIPVFVHVDEAGTRELFKAGIYSEDHSRLVLEGKRMCWAESAFHERWTAADYSVVKVHDLVSGKTWQVGERTRWFSPALSPDGERMVVAETDDRGKHRVLVMSAADGTDRRELITANDRLCTHLRWTSDGRSVLAVVVTSEGNAIVQVDVANGQERMLVPFTRTPLSTPVDGNGMLYFSAGAGGTNNIHALNIASGRIYRVTNERFGAFDPLPSSDGSKLLFTSYDALGYRPMEMAIDPAMWSAAELNGPSDIRFHAQAEQYEGKPDPRPALPGGYVPARFRGITSGLLSAYGWFPMPDPPEYGLEVYTQNVMSTLRGTLGAAYNTNEERMRYSALFTYAGLYPLVNVQWTRGGRRVSTLEGSDALSEQRSIWTENVMSAGLSLPLRLTQGSHATQLTLGSWIEHFEVTRKDTLDENVSLGGRSFSAFRGSFEFDRVQPQARRQVKPRWGQQLAAEWRSSFDREVERMAISGTLFFPGLLRTHSFNIRGAFREENVSQGYRFVDDKLMPNGMAPFPFERIAFGTVNYELPLLHPDLAAGPIAILQRVRLNLFCGTSEAQARSVTTPYSFAGAELAFDLRAFRLFQMTMLMRVTAGLDPGSPPDLPFQFLVTRFEIAN